MFWITDETERKCSDIKRKITFGQLIIKYINHFPVQVLFDYYGTVSRKMDQVCGLFELH